MAAACSLFGGATLKHNRLYRSDRPGSRALAQTSMTPPRLLLPHRQQRISVSLPRQAALPVSPDRMFAWFSLDLPAHASDHTATFPRRTTQSVADGLGASGGPRSPDL